MTKISKSFLYIIGSAIVILVLLKSYGGSLVSNSATAFEWQKQVAVYFGNETKGSSEDCAKVFPVSRTILNAETFGPGALEALLNGVGEGEQMKGYFTSINSEVLIQKFEIKNKVAYVDFNARFGEVGGSCTVIAIKSQIENTLNNLTDIDSVVMSVNGQTEGILEP